MKSNLVATVARSIPVVFSNALEPPNTVETTKNKHETFNTKTEMFQFVEFSNYLYQGSRTTAPTDTAAMLCVCAVARNATCLSRAINEIVGINHKQNGERYQVCKIMRVSCCILADWSLIAGYCSSVTDKLQWGKWENMRLLVIVGLFLWKICLNNRFESSGQLFWSILV